MYGPQEPKSLLGGKRHYLPCWRK